MQKHLTGLIAAVHTPMNSDGSLNLSVIEKQAESLMANGVNGAFVCGTNGEGLSLTIDERMKIARRWMDVADKDLNIIVHVGHNCLYDSKALASHAQEIGADAIAAVGPSFFKPKDAESLADLCAMIASSASELPFYYYHIPGLSGVNISMIEFLREGQNRISNLAGIKFSHTDIMDLAQCLTFEDGKYNVLFGKDEILLSAMVFGAKGAVGSTYNFAAPLYHIIMTAFQAGEIESARIEQNRAVEMVEILIKYGGISAGKAIMKMIGIDCGPVRPPLLNLTNEEYDKMYADLSEAGFFTYCSVQAKNGLST